ncbi:MAG TPA: hypothetical protein VGD69_16980 [Herpetosiphonaceae bacterium]
MWFRTIPKDEQINAVLTNQLWTLLRRCNFRRPSLQRKWSVSVGDIVSAARQQGLDSFVQQDPGGEGIYLVPRPGGYEVAYMERGCQMFEERFEHLETAFTHWVKALLDAYRLPHDPGR